MKNSSSHNVLKVVFCGTPDFSLPSLELLHNHPHIKIVKVITMPDRPAGRGEQLKSPPVAEYAKLHKLPLLQTENINKEETALAELKEMGVDLFIVLAFAQFLGEKILSLPALGCFNIHTSLLPRYRGAAPIQYALLNGDETTGVSIQRMVKKMDAGDLVISDEIAVSPTETGAQLYTRLKFQAALSLNRFVHQVLENSLTYTIQDESKVCFAPTLKKEDGLIRFSESSTQKILNQIRALTPWPGTYCYLNEKRLKVIRAASYDGLVKLAPGEVRAQGGVLSVGTLDGMLRLQEVQLEGKKVCTDTELLNGLKSDKLVINQ